MSKLVERLNKNIIIFLIFFLGSVVSIVSYFSPDKDEKVNPETVIIHDTIVLVDSLLIEPEQNDRDKNSAIVVKSNSKKTFLDSSNNSDSTTYKMGLKKELVVVLNKSDENSELIVNDIAVSNSGIFRSIRVSEIEKSITLKLISKLDTCKKIVNLNDFDNKKRIVLNCH